MRPPTVSFLLFLFALPLEFQVTCGTSPSPRELTASVSPLGQGGVRCSRGPSELSTSVAEGCSIPVQRLVRRPGCEAPLSGREKQFTEDGAAVALPGEQLASLPPTEASPGRCSTACRGFLTVRLPGSPQRAPPGVPGELQAREAAQTPVSAALWHPLASAGTSRLSFSSPTQTQGSTLGFGWVVVAVVCCIIFSPSSFRNS